MNLGQEILSHSPHLRVQGSLSHLNMSNITGLQKRNPAPFRVLIRKEMNEHNNRPSDHDGP